MGGGLHKPYMGILQNAKMGPLWALLGSWLHLDSICLDISLGFGLQPMFDTPRICDSLKLFLLPTKSIVNAFLPAPALRRSITCWFSAKSLGNEPGHPKEFIYIYIYMVPPPWNTQVFGQKLTCGCKNACTTHVPASKNEALKMHAFLGLNSSIGT